MDNPLCLARKPECVRLTLNRRSQGVSFGCARPKAQATHPMQTVVHRCAPLLFRYFWEGSAYLRSSHACGTGTTQMFIERLSAESMAD